METALIRRLPKLERNQLIDMLKLRNLLKYKSFDEDQDLLINYQIFQREQLLDSYHWKLKWLIPLLIQDWALISCTFPGGDHLSLLATRRPAGVCSRETGQTCLLPRWGFSTYWAKEWGWRGVFEGVQLRGENMRPSFPVGLSYLFLWDGSPPTEGTRNRRCGWNQEGGNVRARCLLFAREWVVSLRRESSPQTDEWRERMVKLGGLEEDEASFFRARSHQYWMK